MPDGIDHAGLEVDRTIERLLGVSTTLHWHLDEDAGRLVLAGALPRKPQLERLLQRLDAIDGVREIENDVVVSPQQARADQQRAVLLRARRDLAGLDADLQFGIIGPFVVLRGGAADPETRSAAIELAAGVPGVTCVVDADGGQAN